MRGQFSILLSSVCIACVVGSDFAHAADLAPVVVAAATPALPPWTVSLNSEVRYFSWTGARGDPVNNLLGTAARGGQGTEIYTPTTLSVSGMINPLWKFEGLIRSGYVSAHQGTQGETATVGTPTDTVPSATLTYLGFNGVQPFGSINLNVPTGRTGLYGTSSFARMDPDLVDVPTFGEGFNVGPTLGVNIPFNESTVGTVSAGYTARGNFRQDGAYNPFSLLPQMTNRVHPGDLFTLSTSITGQIAQWTVQVSANYVLSTKVQNNEVDQFQGGNQLSLSSVVSYAFNDSFSIKGTGSYSLSFSNRSPTMVAPFIGLAREMANSNSSLVSLRVEPTYRVDKFSVGPLGSVQYRDANAYSPISLQFVPAKTRFSAGGQAAYQVTPASSVNVRLEQVWTHVNDATLSVGVPGIARQSFIAVLGGTYTF